MRLFGWFKRKRGPQPICTTKVVSPLNPDGSWTAEVSVGGESSLVRIYSISSLLR